MEQPEYVAGLTLEKEIRDSFRVGRLEEADSVDGYIRSVYNRILLVEAGSGHLFVDGTGYPVCGAEIFLLSKGQAYRFLPGSKVKGFELAFGDCFWERTPASFANCKALLFNDVSLRQQIALHPHSLAEVRAIADTMLSEYREADYPNQLDVLAAYLKILMIKLANLSPDLYPVVHDNGSEIYRRFLELVSIGFKEYKEVAHYAQVLSVTPRNLTDICKQKCGRGAKEIIAGQLIAEAKRQLQFSAKPVKELAYAFSFATPEQFSHFFKKHTSVSPTDFRERYVNIGR